MTTNLKNTYEIAKIGRRYVIRREPINPDYVHQKKWYYYDKDRPFDWIWTEECLRHATKFWTLNGAKKALNKFLEGPKAVYRHGDDDFV